MSSLENLLAKLFTMTEVDRNHSARQLQTILSNNDLAGFIHLLTTEETTPLDPDNTPTRSEFIDVLKKVLTLQNELDPRDNRVIRSRKDTLGRIDTYLTAANKRVPTYVGSDNRIGYLPYFTKNQIVMVNFSGLGAELKGKHPAIVWESDTYQDTFTVIPLSSYKPNKHSDSATCFVLGVGLLYGMNPPTGNPSGELTNVSVADLRQLTTVSHKRLKKETFHNATSNHEEYAFLSAEQSQRVKEGLQAFLFQEPTLYEAEIQNYPNRIPVLLNSNVQYQHMYRVYKKDPSSTEDRLIYTVEGDTTLYSIERKLPQSQFSTEDIEKSVQRWLHSKAHVQARRSADDVRLFNYGKLQSMAQTVQQPSQVGARAN
ncbi:type II toxin-antitoxin system PemK/MazF family toxin [Tumebacillus permanentifrigoris]|uniref:PemK-like, MazF-like toxin of type II toxin-antitoxin system n=1 Tax=Tumebacillus permanentifrigoris TaxID=378543 RepID=A0A316DEK3_9BACL|nr:type II toxin-antitoxin system PemK/MazF family toxin [Tumebacillus permanentifrigoris]PWK16474.1 PemK-like, MazF-like toxin of type II toxin-antitoxin system [Tumebacillus permanentifrigoris]